MARVIQVGESAFSSGSFAPIPVGSKVRVSVFDIEETVTGPNSTNPGSPQFVFTAKVTEDFEWDEADGSHQNAKGREIRYNYISLDPNAKGAWALVAFAEAVGWKTEKGKGVEIPDNLKEVLGTEFIAKIGQTASQKTNPDTGQPYMNNRVTGYAKIKAGGGGTPTPEKKSWDEL